MKSKIYFTLFLFLFTITLSAQSPALLNYQAVLRNSTGDISANQTITLKFDILSNSVNGPVIYSETHNTSTNEYGLINLKIGDGTIINGNFSSISWGVEKLLSGSYN